MGRNKSNLLYNTVLFLLFTLYLICLRHTLPNKHLLFVFKVFYREVKLVLSVGSVGTSPCCELAVVVESWLPWILGHRLCRVLNKI